MKGSVCDCFKQIGRVCCLKSFFWLQVVLSFVTDCFLLFNLPDANYVGATVGHLSVIVKVNVYPCYVCVYLAAIASSKTDPV